MEIDKHGFYKPVLVPNLVAPLEESAARACPFLYPEHDEDDLANRFLPATQTRDHKIGKYLEVFAGHVNENGFRQAGSSGGMVSWIATELLRKGMIDGVIHARPVVRNQVEDPFFRYGISRSVEEINNAAHSHYHVVEISEVLSEVKQKPGRYLFIGVPCMVKAVRRAQLADSDISDRIVFTIALVCGHLKSVHWAVSLGWAAGVIPEELSSINFRVKSKNVPAKAYYFKVKNRTTGEEIVQDSAPLTGGKFNLGAMMPDACNYCDDIVGETADLTIGDAWLPRYSFDWRGKNMLVSRNETLNALIRAASDEDRVHIETMTPKEAADAQSGGFRQRREGLAYRLARDRAAGRWTPKKRNLPDMIQPGYFRARIYDLRAEVSQRSRISFRMALDSGDIKIYDRDMSGIFKRLRTLELAVAALRILSVRLRALVARHRT